MPLRRRAVGRLVALLTVGLLGATSAAVGAVGLVGWGAATLFAVGPAVQALSPLLAWFVAGVVLGVPLAVVGFGGVVATLVDQAVSARTRLRRRAGRTLAAYDEELSLLGLDDVVDRFDDRDPDARAEDRVERLKAAYVAGDVDDAEFERRVEDLVADDDVDTHAVLSLRESVRDHERDREYEYERG